MGRQVTYHTSGIIHSRLDLPALIPKILHKWCFWPSVLLLVWTTILRCQRSTEKQTHFKPSNSHQSPLPTQNSQTLHKPRVSWTLRPARSLNTQVVGASTPGLQPVCTIFTRFSGFCRLCALPLPCNELFYLPGPSSTAPSCRSSCAFNSHSILKQTTTVLHSINENNRIRSTFY